MSRLIPTYDECYAFVLLSKFGIKDCILSDKPDIISNDRTWGIEIVSALFEGEHKLETYFIKQKEKDTSKDKDKDNDKKEYPLPDGYESFGYGVIGPCLCEHKLSPDDLTIEDSIKIAIDMIKKKKEKSINYHVEKISLYITSELCFRDEERLKGIASRMYNEAKDVFQYLYINVRDSNNLIICSKCDIFVHHYNQHEIAIEAYKLYDSYQKHTHED